MNAGAYGTEVKDVLVEIGVMDRAGALHTYAAEDLKMSYRHTKLPEEGIVVHVVFKGRIETQETVRKRLKYIKAQRNDTQPISEKRVVRPLPTPVRPS